LKRVSIILIVGLFILALFPRCAKVVTPTGGPKDTLPPTLIRSNPSANAINFSGQKIVFEFDEYIQLKDVQQKMLVSPPLKNRPQINPKGKRFEIEFIDTLKSNTTYTVYLGDAVEDNNERNPIKSFEFAFSTGSVIDTLKFSGKVEDSFSREPVEGALVMLYDTFIDSLPYNQLPVHIAKTNKEGKFTVNNLKYLDYKLVIITDANSDYKYNQGVEDIAFFSEPIKKQQVLEPSSDLKLTLRTFREDLPYQIITGYNRPERGLLELNFSRKPLGGFNLSCLNKPKENQWYLTEPDAQGDTVKVWLTSDIIIAIDTLKVLVTYQKTDSLNKLHPQKDTLKFIFTDKIVDEKSTRQRKKEKEETIEQGFSFVTSVQNGKFAIPDQPFDFTLPKPAKKVDVSKIMILNETDSILESQVELKVDSLNPRIYKFMKAWKPNSTYRMLVLPGCFEGIDKTTNDSLKLSFIGADPENFGILIAKTDSLSAGIIVDLLTDKGKLVSRKSSSDKKPITFSFIEPGKYKLRFIEDLNKNGEWDSGNYLKKIQPERVFEFTDGKNKGEINIRANWENEIVLSIPKP